MKRKVYITLSLILLLSTYTALAQIFTLYGDRSFGTTIHDYHPSIVSLNGSNFMLCGYTGAHISGDKTDSNCTNVFDIWLLKIDTGFNILWDKTYGGAGGEIQTIPLITKNFKQILISCESNSDSSCTKTSHSRNYPALSLDYWMIVLDSNGNYSNQFTYGGKGQDGNPTTVELTSGSLITCGGSNSSISGDKSVSNNDSTLSSSDYWVIKSDNAGNKLWDKVFGGIGSEYSNNQSYLYGYNIIADKNDAFVLAGTTNSPPSIDITDSSKGSSDVWIIKIDSLGNKLWDRRYGGTGNDQCNHIIHTLDNGYIICGLTTSPQGLDVSDTSRGSTDCWVLKLDSMGHKIWDKRYGGNNNDYATWIEEAPGGGYWVSGTSQSEMSGDVSEPKYALLSNYDYWIFKIDNYGNKIWDKRFGGPVYNMGSQFIIMPDSSIFLAGMSFAGTNAVKTDTGKGGWDYWVVHFKYTDTTSTVGINNTTSFSNSISLYPNPTKDVVTIKSQNEKIKSVELITLEGASLFSQKFINAKTAQLDLRSYSSGFYFIKITGENYSVIKKVVRL